MEWRKEPNLKSLWQKALVTIVLGLVLFFYARRVHIPEELYPRIWGVIWMAEVVLGIAFFTVLVLTGLVLWIRRIERKEGR